MVLLGRSGIIPPNYDQNQNYNFVKLDVSRQGIRYITSSLIGVNIFNCSFNDIRILPDDVCNVSKYLNCERNKIKKLPKLSDTLEYLFCSYNRLTKLHLLPLNLLEIVCSSNYITKIEYFPISLIYIDISHNGLQVLPELPPTLIKIDISYNYIKKLPKLPETLEHLYLNYNFVEEFPALPNSIKMLNSVDNKLTKLPIIPDSLQYISVSHNPYTKMPFLNEYLYKNQIYPNVYPNVVSSDLLRRYVNGFYKFAHLFYSLKYKKQFRRWLWEKVREPIIKKRLSPERLNSLIEQNLALDLEQILFIFFEK